MTKVDYGQLRLCADRKQVIAHHHASTSSDDPVDVDVIDDKEVDDSTVIGDVMDVDSVVGDLVDDAVEDAVDEDLLKVFRPSLFIFTFMTNFKCMPKSTRMSNHPKKQVGFFLHKRQLT